MTVSTTSRLLLSFGATRIGVESNDETLIERLRRYFRGFVAPVDSRLQPHSLLQAIEEQEHLPAAELVPWEVGGKESFVDYAWGRVVRKLRTGVEISIAEDSWQSSWTIRGPLQRNFSQVVNLIGAIYGLKLADRGAAMIHASAVCDAEQRAIAFVGQSGMGKSSVAVRLMELGFDYISNDRVLLEAAHEGDVLAHALPKLPRVNPGTLLGGERTRLVLEPEARRRYQQLSREDLWAVEDKYDLEIEGVMGRRWFLEGRLVCAFVLGWERDGAGVNLQRLTPGQALQELRLVSKSFGPFDLRLDQRLDRALLEAARLVPIYRVTGLADPGGLARELAAGSFKDFS